MHQDLSDCSNLSFIRDAACGSVRNLPYGGGGNNGKIKFH